MAEAVKEKPKGPLGKLKEAVDDKEEQLQYLGTLIRVIVLSLIHISEPTRP